MKKLLLFSILFLTCSLGLMNAKATYCNDGSSIKIPNIFDDELYDISGSYRSKIVYNIPLQVYKEKYIQSYYDLVAYINANYKYYYFGVDSVFMWNSDDIELTLLFYNTQEDNYNELAFRLSSPFDIEDSFFIAKNVKQYRYYNLKDGFSENKNSSYSWSDLYPMASYNYQGNRSYFAYSSTECNLTINYPENYASSGLTTNAKIVYRGASYKQDGRDIISNRTERFYNTIQIGDKIYQDGDYITGSGKLENPKVTDIEYFTEDNNKYGVSVTVDYKASDKNRYSYYISFENSDNFIDISSYVDNGIYNFTSPKNFNAYFKVVDNLEQQEAYSNLLIDSINENYLKHSATFTESYGDDDYYIKDDIKYLKKLELTLSINNYKPNLFKYWVSIGNSSNFQEIYYDSWIHTFYKNTTIYYKVTDNFGNYIYASTYQIARLAAISTVGQDVIFDETCYTKPWEDDDHSSVAQDRCIVSVEFINPDDTKYNYYIDNGNGVFFQVTMADLNKNIYKNDTSVITTLTVRITDKNGKEVLLKSYTNTGFKNHEGSFSNILDSFTSPISNVFHVFYTFFTSLPMGIRNMFSAILFISLATVLVKLLL